VRSALSLLFFAHAPRGLYRVPGRGKPRAMSFGVPFGVKGRWSTAARRSPEDKIASLPNQTTEREV
jgi:hypothetical protein